MARGKPSEIDHLNGFVARRGARARRADAGQPGAACAGQAGRSGRGPADDGVSRRRTGADRRGSDAVQVPPEFAQALRELGPRRAGEPLLGAPLTGGVSSDIWCIDTARGPVCAKRALAKLRVAADWRAPIERNRYEARWMQVANEALPGCRAARARPASGLGVLVMSYLRAGEHALWKQPLRDGRAEPATRARRRRDAGADPRAFGCAARSWPRSSHRRDLLRHPPRALPAGDRAPPSGRRGGARGAGRDDAATMARPRARRRQPEEHPGRRRRAGAARCRMRVVGRPGVRRRVLPQPPAAQVPVDAGGDGRASWPRSTRWRRRYLAGVDWEPRDGDRARAPRRCCRACCWRASTASRRSSTSTTTPSASRCAASAAALLRRARVTRLDARRRRLARGARAA